MEKTVKVALRYDDFSAESPIEIESGILNACARHRVHCTFGVIPLNLPTDRIALLQKGVEEGYLEVALHGLTHKTRHPRRKSEFVGVPREDQVDMLRQGLTALGSLAGAVRTFIPPWNSYDHNTLDAIASVGLTTLSADGAGKSKPNGALRYVPATCLVTEIREAVAHARSLVAAKPGRTPMVVAYFHPYEFAESGSPRAKFTLAEFEDTLAWLAAQADVESLSISELGRLDVAGAETFRSFSRWHRLVPSFLEKTLLPAFWAYPYPALPRSR